MPLEYLLDHARQRLTIIGRDPVDVPDVLACLERQVGDDAWAYGALALPAKIGETLYPSAISV